MIINCFTNPTIYKYRRYRQFIKENIVFSVFESGIGLYDDISCSIKTIGNYLQDTYCADYNKLSEFIRRKPIIWHR